MFWSIGIRKGVTRGIPIFSVLVQIPTDESVDRIPNIHQEAGIVVAVHSLIVVHIAVHLLGYCRVVARAVGILELIAVFIFRTVPLAIFEGGPDIARYRAPSGFSNVEEGDAARHRLGFERLKSILGWFGRFVGCVGKCPSMILSNNDVGRRPPLLFRIPPRWSEILGLLLGERLLVVGRRALLLPFEMCLDLFVRPCLRVAAQS